MLVWSSRASCAAARAASNTKSVRFFPRTLAARSIKLRSSDLMRRFNVSRLANAVLKAGRVVNANDACYRSTMSLQTASLSVDPSQVPTPGAGAGPQKDEGPTKMTKGLCVVVCELVIFVKTRLLPSHRVVIILDSLLSLARQRTCVGCNGGCGKGWKTRHPVGSMGERARHQNTAYT